MKLRSMKVKSFRTITAEQTFNLENGLTLVGPNNCGKTNVLHALMAFFTGYDKEYEYKSTVDLPFRERNVKTSITCYFTGDPDGTDREIFEKLNRVKDLLGLPLDHTYEFSINVYFTNDNPVYQVYPGVKKPAEISATYSLAQKAFITSVLDNFQWYYIPSNKSIQELYNEFITPFIKTKVAEVLSVFDVQIRASIRVLTESMNEVLLRNGLNDLHTHLEYPNNSLESFISGFDLYVEDQNKSSIFTKGMGLQAVVLLSSFKWITEQQSNKDVIWLIEEPETFMHPGLALKCSKILDELSTISTVLKTTHAINFIPSNINTVQGIQIGSLGNTVTTVYSSHLEATKDIRESLGVKFADYFGLSERNLFVEGKTDKIYLEWLLKELPPVITQHFPVLMSNELQIRDMNGTTDLKGFLKANYGLIQKEVAVVSLFDGDDAGIKAIRELSGYFGNKGYGFHANLDYVIIPNNMPIESLFPAQWVLELHQGDQDVWFEEILLDAENNITFFKIRDKSKMPYLEAMITRAMHTDLDEWITPFGNILSALERSLTAQQRRING